ADAVPHRLRRSAWRPARRRRARLPRVRAPLPAPRLRRQRAVLAGRVLLRSEALRQGGARVPRRRAALADGQQGARRAAQARLQPHRPRRRRQGAEGAARAARDLPAYRSGAPRRRAPRATFNGGTEVKRLLLIAIVGVGVADARAQTMSDLPQTETSSGSQSVPSTKAYTEPPAGQVRPYYPGMPVPQPEAAPKATAKGQGPGGVILYDDERSGEIGGGEFSVAPGGPPAEVPDTHTVQKGDTLWDLSARYYRNAWGWPKMWSYNP